MSTDPLQTPPAPQDSDDTSPLPPAQVGHSEAQWEYYPTYELDDVQFRAIELTVQGLKDTQIAEMLSIDRKTLWRWKTQDEEYRQALADARVQLYSAVADRYRTLLLRATGVMAKFLEDSMDNNRFRAAYALLMMAGCFKPIPVMPMTAQDELSRFPMPELPPKVG